MNRSMLLITLSMVVSTVVGCAATEQGRHAQMTGFLSSYGDLEEGAEGEALLVYRNPRADFTKYDKMLIDPVAIWAATSSDLEGTPDDERQGLARKLHEAITKRIRTDYEIVDAPGEGVLRLRVALTDASKSQVLRDTLSAINPVGLVLSAMNRLATGTATFVGGASAEAEIQDSVSKEVLLAGIDRRVGRKSLSGSMKSWGDVEQIFAEWAEQIARRLARERAAGAQR